MLAEPGGQYAAYFKGAPGFAFSIDLPVGAYQVQWLDVVTGASDEPTLFTHGGGPAALRIPDGFDECAFKMVRVAETENR